MRWSHEISRRQAERRRGAAGRQQVVVIGGQSPTNLAIELQANVQEAVADGDEVHGAWQLPRAKAAAAATEAKVAGKVLFGGKIQSDGSSRSAGSKTNKWRPLRTQPHHSPSPHPTSPLSLSAPPPLTACPLRTQPRRLPSPHPTSPLALISHHEPPMSTALTVRWCSTKQWTCSLLITS